MSNTAFNPYAPPATRESDFTRTSGQSAFRVEKSTIVLWWPYILPAICFLTGSQHNLSKCEFTLRVMPRWWQYAVPIVLFCSQAIAMSAGFLIPKLTSTIPAGLPVAFVAAIAGMFFPVATISGMIVFSKKVTITGYYQNADSLRQQRRRKVMLAWLFFVAVVIFVLVSILLFDNSPLWAIAAFPTVVFASVFHFKNRNPWSRLGGLLKRDDSVAIYGLSPACLAACRQGMMADSET